jgi:hypothetical protein
MCAKIDGAINPHNKAFTSGLLKQVKQNLYCQNLYSNFSFNRYRCWNERKCHINWCEGTEVCFFEKDNGFDQVCHTNKNIRAIVENFNMNKYLKSIDVDQGDQYSFPR